ncbi:hypothetical protein SAMN05428642_1065 [Flaviramulus basaltis]|uniref:Uncharacterized protein n=1 Tax=Flaviramulus basaltis TaxID=369401 RepID=A0A1K2IRH5_9FLAO|nr:hypothetical protein [Flaviramulus basaltis]SFZ94967.1 hypothetical protein SAMN05428642_1065 [Flaviramulus basaltis]
MKDETLKRNILFWIDQNIIYCKISKNVGKNNIGVELEDTFSQAITMLSYGKYIPILINIREINFLTSIRLFIYLSNNLAIKNLVLSKTFLVDSFALKILLFLYSLTIDTIVPNRVFNIHSSAIKHCNKKYMEFNIIG